MKWIQACALSLALMAAPAAHSQTVDRNAWLEASVRTQLVSGMSRDQVEKVVGVPTRTRTTRSVAGGTWDYEYRSSDGNDWMVVTFMGGNSMLTYSVARLGNADASQGTQRWREPSAWERVNPGMELKQVEEILGQPSAMSYAGGMTAAEMLTGWLYDVGSETDADTGIVQFDPSGKVVSVMTPLFADPR